MKVDQVSIKRLVQAVLALCAAVLIPASARAGNCSCTTTTLNVMAAYSVFSATSLQTSAAFSITCNGNATYNVSFSTGNSGSYATRRLDQAAGDSLNYNIYTDNTRSTVWAGTNVLVFNASGSQTFSQDLYLSIFPLQDSKYSGNAYTDTINVTMTPDASTGGPTRSCSITLSENVTAECRSPLATLAFGSYDPVALHSTVASPLDQVTNLMYTCTKGISATILLDNGSNALAGARRLAGPSANFLSYDIFTNSLRTVRWSTTVPANTVTAASTSKNIPLGGVSGLPVYGRIPGGQDVGTGAYNDSVTATINY